MIGRPPTLLTEWARLLLGSLRRAGVRDVVISPGSRSTPFAYAALRDPGLRCRTIIDERSAAFFALGQARMTGRPVLLVCTSGSAAANYFPAVVEAAEAGVPMLLLTADRPLELQRAAAPQTIDQVELYGRYARAYVELGTPDPDPRMLRAIPRLAAQAVLAAHTPRPGPVHINARARKPLEPVESDDDAARSLRALVDRLLERVPTATPPLVGPGDGVDRLADACRRARRGLIVCGPASPAEGAPYGPTGMVDRAASVTGFPVAAEWASQCRRPGRSDAVLLDAFDALLDVPGFAAEHRPDLLIQLGRPPTASAWNAAMEAWDDVERWVVSPHDWADPWNGATAVIAAPVHATLRALVDRLDPDPPDRAAWRDRLAEANRRARAAIDAVLHPAVEPTSDGPSGGGFSEGAAVRIVVERLPSDAVVAVANSLPIRELDLFAPAGPDVPVVSQRGANGIDGLVSGAAGAAAAAEGRPVTLLIGDVAFLHDLGGLAAARDLTVRADAPPPLTIVVLDNGGGRIFERLPLAETLAADPALDAWLTPPRLDIEAAAHAFGLEYARAADAAGLVAALDPGGGDPQTGRPQDGRPGPARVIHVVVPENGTTAHQRELRHRIAAAVRT